MPDRIKSAICGYHQKEIALLKRRNMSEKTKKIAIALSAVFLAALIVFLSVFIPQETDIQNNKQIINDVIAEIDDNPQEGIGENGESVQVPHYSSSSRKLGNSVGWIYIPHSNVNYPIMSASDNYYLTHNPYGQYSRSGSIFCYDNQTWSPYEDMDKNIVLFGHHIRHSTMFGYLDTIRSRGYVNNDNRNKIFIQTDDGEYEYEMFSCYAISETEDFNRINFANSQDFIDYCNMLLDRSETPKSGGWNFTEGDKIITLVSCTYIGGYDRSERIVVHAVML